MRSDFSPSSDDGLEPSKRAAVKRLPKPSGRTVEELITTHLRGDGAQGLTVRELKRALHMANETVKLAIRYPERLSMANIFDLAPLLGKGPEQLLADVFHQLMVRQQQGLLHTPRQLRALDKRSSRPPSAAKPGCV